MVKYDDSDSHNHLPVVAVVSAAVDTTPLTAAPKPVAAEVVANANVELVGQPVATNQLMIKSATLNDTPCHLLIDYGASHNVIAPGRMLGLLKTIKVHVTRFDGVKKTEQTSELAASVVMDGFKFSGMEFMEWATAPTYDGILG